MWTLELLGWLLLYHFMLPVPDARRYIIWYAETRYIFVGEQLQHGMWRSGLRSWEAN